MHFAERAYALAVLTALLAIAGTWSSDPAFAGVWRWPALLLLIGLAVEGWFARRTAVRAGVDTSTHALLGREQPAAFAFTNESPRDITLEYATTMPVGFEGVHETRVIAAPRGQTGRDAVSLLPVR